MRYSQSALRRMFTSGMNNFIYMLKSIFISAICDPLPTSHPRVSTVIPKISKYRYYHHTTGFEYVDIFFGVSKKRFFAISKTLYVILCKSYSS